MEKNSAVMADFYNSGWFKSRPPEIQKLALEFPPTTVMGDYFVIGWTESKDGKAVGLKLSKRVPIQPYKEAIANSIYVCLDCIRSGKFDSCKDE